MNGLDNIVNKIIADAEAQAAETLAKAQAEADTILENYRANAAVENKQIIDNASKANRCLRLLRPLVPPVWRQTRL